MKIVYLDQNQWIQLARAHHGKIDDPLLLRALEALKGATKAQRLALPLSAVHYIEATRVASVGPRTRLGVVMWELSRGLTIASYTSILTYEIETALAKRFPRVRPRPFTLLSQGVAHAFGMDARPYRLPSELRAALPRDLAEHLEAVGTGIIERALVTGRMPPALELPATFGFTEHNRRFQEHLRTLHLRVSQVTPERREDALYAISIVDILDELNEVIAHHGLDAHEVASSRDHFRALVDDVPIARVNLHLYRQLLRNPTLRPKENDLEDWGALTPAAAHCDALVCEKHFATLLHRDGFAAKAKVLSDVRALADALGYEAAA